MVSEDAAVWENGAVTGTLKYITGYTGFDVEPQNQEGYFFPFTLQKAGATMTFKKNGAPVKEDIPWEANNVFRVTKNDTFTILVDDAEVITLRFNGATFAPKGRARRNA